jgi:hypothetical protein
VNKICAFSRHRNDHEQKTLDPGALVANDTNHARELSIRNSHKKNRGDCGNRQQISAQRTHAHSLKTRKQSNSVSSTISRHARADAQIRHNHKQQANVCLSPRCNNHSSTLFRPSKSCDPSSSTAEQTPSHSETGEKNHRHRQKKTKENGSSTLNWIKERHGGSELITQKLFHDRPR